MMLYILLFCQASGGIPFHQFYASSLRAPLFTGFFTLSSFLLAANAFIVINMKKDVYESQSYRKRLAELRKVNPKLTTFGGLIRLSKLLFGTIVCAFGTAAMQLTLGLVENDWAARVCLAAAILTLVLVGFVLYTIQKNIKVWLEQIEIDSAGAVPQSGSGTS